MKLDHSSNVLVIVGGWNRHIFTEDWIKRYIFPTEQDEFKIEMLVSRNFNTPFVFPRIVSKDSRRNFLIIFLTPPLPHTVLIFCFLKTKFMKI